MTLIRRLTRFFMKEVKMIDRYESLRGRIQRDKDRERACTLVGHCELESLLAAADEYEALREATGNICREPAKPSLPSAHDCRHNPGRWPAKREDG